MVLWIAGSFPRMMSLDLINGIET